MFTKQRSHILCMILANYDEYQVVKGHTRVSINLEKKQCSYNEWIMTNSSCKYVIPFCASQNNGFKRFLSCVLYH
jgi:hypothetical protein